MTGEEYQRVRLALNLTHADFASALGIATRTSSNYAKADEVPKPIALLVETLLKEPPPHREYELRRQPWRARPE